MTVVRFEDIYEFLENLKLENCLDCWLHGFHCTGFTTGIDEKTSI
jgi:hypothetical protein